MRAMLAASSYRFAAALLGLGIGPRSHVQAGNSDLTGRGGEDPGLRPAHRVSHSLVEAPQRSCPGPTALWRLTSSLPVTFGASHSPWLPFRAMLNKRAAQSSWDHLTHHVHTAESPFAQSSAPEFQEHGSALTHTDANDR